MNLEKKEATAATSEEQCFIKQILFLVQQSTTAASFWTAERVHDCLRSMSDSLGITVRVLELRYYWTFCRLSCPMVLPFPFVNENLQKFGTS